MAKNRRPGQPTKYRKEYCAMLVDHMAKGFSFESFAAVVKTHCETLYEWKQKHQAFSEAHKQGRDANRHTWEKLALKACYNNNGAGKNFPAAVWIFNMKNRFPAEWKDRQQLDLTGAQSAKVVLAYSLEEEKSE